MSYIKPIKIDDINLNNKDYLQTKIYSDQLTEMLKNYYSSDSEDPLYIGIIGEWGSGKSTIVKTAISNLKDVKIFIYDAWKYEDDSFRRTFIKSILDQSDISKLSSEYNKINDSLYENCSISSNSFIERIRLSIIKDKKFTGLWSYIIAIAVVVIVMILGFIIMEQYKNILGMLFTVLSAIGFFNILYAETTYSKSMLFSPEQFYNTFKKILKKRNGRNNLIFIDNLDRCEGENLILTLKSIKGFYVEKGDSFKKKIVFIIPLDNNSLNKAYNLNDANHYVDKIFDNVIYLKKITNTDKIDFINQILKEHSDIEKIFPESVREVLTCCNVKTPREIIKLINDYVIKYLVFQKCKKEDFFSIQCNKDYLMKSVILNKYFHHFYELAYENIERFKHLEETAETSREVIIKEYGDECYKFLIKTTNVNPSNYYDFYSNQDHKSYSLPQIIEEAIDSHDIDTIKKYDNKAQLINNFVNGIHYYIRNNMWGIRIAKRFIIFADLINEDYFDYDYIEAVISKWNNVLFNNDNFYKEIIYKKKISFNQLLLFIKKANPSDKFVKKVFDGIEGQVFSDSDEDNYNFTVEILNNNLIKELDDKETNYINKFLKEICDKELFTDEKYFEIVKTPLIKYVKLENIKLIISKLDSNQISLVVSIVNSLKENNYSYDRTLVNTIISYINNKCKNEKDYNYLSTLLAFVINQENPKEFISSLNITFSFTEYENFDFIDIFIERYIQNNICNNTFKSFINIFKNNSNIDSIIKSFNKVIDIMSQDFLDFYVEYIGKISESSFERNIYYIINLYKIVKDKKQLLQTFKTKGLLRLVYDNIPVSLEKEQYIIDAINILTSEEEKIQNIFLFESDPDRFKKFIDSEYSLSNMLKIIENVEKTASITLSVQKIVSIIEDKDNILEDDFNELLNILCSEKINKMDSKRIIKKLLYKIDVNKLRILKDKVIITDKRLITAIQKKIDEEMMHLV